MISPIGLPLFSNKHLFQITQDQKVFTRLVTGLIVKVWSSRPSDLYPHEMWCEQHFLSFSSSFSYMLTIQHIIHSLMECWTPHFLCIFTNFISKKITLCFSFFSSFSLFFVWRGSIYLKTIGQRELLLTSWFTFAFLNTRTLAFGLSLILTWTTYQKSWGLYVVERKHFQFASSFFQEKRKKLKVCSSKDHTFTRLATKEV